MVYLEPSHTSVYGGAFLQNKLMATSCQLFLQKNSIIDVWLGSKYASVCEHSFIKKKTQTHFPVHTPKLLGTAFFIEQLWWLLWGFIIRKEYTKKER